MLVFVLLFASVDLSDFPYHLQITSARISGSYEQGHGNLFLGGTAFGGIEFLADGCDRFGVTNGPDYYKAKMEGLGKLDIAMSSIGSSKVKVCKMKFNLKPYTFAINPLGREVTVPMKSPGN